MKIVLAGGSGQVGEILLRAFRAKGYEVIVLTRGPLKSANYVAWNGQTLGDWVKQVDGSDVIINLAGRNVNCRYTVDNLKDMMKSRVEPTRLIGAAIEKLHNPPRLWLQMSTATIYAHRFDQANDEFNGIIGGQESNTPDYWSYSVKIAKAWEEALDKANTPRTRKVALRSAIILSPDRHGIFDTLYNMTRWGFGGSVGGGRQYVSWIHEKDFAAAVDFIIEHSEISGAINLAAPNPLPQKKFMADLRKYVGMPIGLPATKWMAEIGAFVLRTDTELLLKSRRVMPARLLNAGFKFEYYEWKRAAKDLANRRAAN